jgi:cell division septum initiation protein DivIVA
MDKNIFELTGLELVKKKFYAADKVAELAADARAEFEKLSRENAELKRQLEALSSQKSQISDTLMSARDIARQMIEDAKTQAEETARLAQTQAEETVKAAEKKAELILAGAKTKKDAADAEVSEVQEYALRCVESCVDKLRAQHMEAIEFLNAQWQDFLGGLIIPGDEQPEEVCQPMIEQVEKPVDWMAIADMELPEMEDPYADIDADTFFSAGFYSEQTGANIMEQLKSMMDSIGIPEFEEE